MKINYVNIVIHTKEQQYEEIPEKKVLVNRKPTKAERKKGITVAKRWKTIQAKRIKKKDIVDLRKFVELNYKAELPFYEKIGVRITELLLCSSNGKCEKSDKPGKGANKNYVLKHIKGGKVVNKNTKTKPVVCRIKGITKDGDRLEIRVPTTGNIKITIGMSHNKNNITNDDVLFKYLKTIMKEVILDKKGLPELKEPKISNMPVTGIKLFEGRLRSFETFHKTVVKALEKQQYYYEEPMQTNRKTFDKISIRSDDKRFPTIGVFRTGTIDFLGSKELKWVKKVYEILQRTVERMKLNIVSSSNLRN